MAPAVTATATDYAIITAEDSASEPALLEAFPNARRTAFISPAGAAYATVYEVPAGSTAQVAPLHPGNALYGGIIRLLGNNLGNAAIQAGSVLRVPLVWRLERPTSDDLRRFVHVIGPAKADGSTIYAQHDSAPCDNSVPTWQWRAGEIMVESVKVDLPVDMPSGRYQVFTGWYDAASLQRLPATASTGASLGDTVEVGTIQIGTAGQ